MGIIPAQAGLNELRQEMASNPTAAMLVIGDEILSGRTRDKNMHFLARELAKSGVDFMEARIVPDVSERIIAAINDLRSDYDHVFTSGGIGPTHDDITADAVSAAFGRTIDVRADALKILQDHYASSGQKLTPPRLRMARIPDGASLIQNSISSAPGFTIGNVHVMAGVPMIFEAMVAEVLPHLPTGTPLVSRTVKVSSMEGDIAEALAEIAERYEDISIGSYPFRKDGKIGVNIVLRGRDPESVHVAEAEISAKFVPN